MDVAASVFASQRFSTAAKLGGVADGNACFARVELDGIVPQEEDAGRRDARTGPAGSRGISSIVSTTP